MLLTLFVFCFIRSICWFQYWCVIISANVFKRWEHSEAFLRRRWQKIIEKNLWSSTCVFCSANNIYFLMYYLQIQGLLLGCDQLSIKFCCTQVPRSHNALIYQLIYLPITRTHSKESQRRTSTDPGRLSYDTRWYRHSEVVADTVFW